MNLSDAFRPFLVISSRLATIISRCLRILFQERSLIIVSQGRVKHLTMSGVLQCLVFVAIVAGVGWSSYSTGRFMAARDTLREQSQTIRSVANSRIADNFYYASPGLSPSSGLTPMKKVPLIAAPVVPNVIASIPSLDQTRLYARIAFLENKVDQLKTTNDAIVETVRIKAGSKIQELETILSQTGLNGDVLKKQARAQQAKRDAAQGGPYIPLDVTGTQGSEKEMVENLETMAVLNTIVDGLPLGKPVKEGDVQSGFGARIDPFTRRLAFHAGVDIVGPVNNKIYAPADGKVVIAERDGAYGNCVQIDHEYGVATRYGHLSAIMVTEGQMVKRGDIIGLQGSTGRSTGPHVHYEVRYNGKPINPKNFISVSPYVQKDIASN